jgi:polysaccharide chain length determinant protein (PEP-CTERM system associated)
MIGHRQLTMEDYLAIFHRRKRLLLTCLVAFPVLGLLLSTILPKEYTSQTTVLVQQPAVPEKYVTEIDPGDLKQYLSSLQEQILSRSKLEQIINKFQLYPNDRASTSMDTLVERLRKKITVTPVKPMPESNSNQLPGFTIKVANRDPALAQKLSSEVTSLFMEDNRRIRGEQAEGTTVFLTKEVEDAKAKLDERDTKLAAFKSRYIGELPDDQQANLSILSGLNTQLDAATQAVSQAQQNKAFAESMLAQQLASQSADNPSAQKQLNDMQSQLSALQAKYTDEHPDIIRLKHNISDLKQQMASAQSSASASNKTSGGIDTPEIQQLRAQVHQYDTAVKEKAAEQRDLQRKIGMYQGRLQLSPNVEAQYKQLTHDYQAALDFYNDMLKKRSVAAVQGGLNQDKYSGNFRILDTASLPSSPSFPNPLYFTLGGLAAGLMVGLGSVLALESRDKTLRTEQDVEFFLQLPTLANIPSVEAARRSAASGKHGSSGPRLVANG